MRLATNSHPHEKRKLETQPDEERDQPQLSLHPPALPQYFALAARATNDAIRDWDVKTGELSWPQGLEKLLGYPPSAATIELSFWQKAIHPDDRAQTAGAIRDALASTAETWTGEYRLRRADGTYIQVLERAAIERDARHVALHFVGSLMDITARKQLQEQIVRSQKMEAFGQLAGGVAHDFNNFLTTILGYSDLLLHERSVKGTVASHISEIKSAADRAAALTSQLLAFSRKQPLEPRTLEVNSIVTKIERSLLGLLGENISVACHLHHLKEGAYIKADPGQVTQILVNLAVNARDAMPEGGRLTIETSTVESVAGGDPDCAPDLLEPGEYVMISVADNGAGMSDEVKAHLFEPFFTTKDQTHGSGLGLATSYGIVRQSGGKICVGSKLGKGTTVKIYLPRVPAPPAPGYKKPGTKKLATGTETVLVLEDDVSVRHIFLRILRNLGYDVIEAASSEDAQRLISARGAKQIDLLVTDVVMPQMSGRHFADWLRKTSPRTKVVFVSGYLDESLQLCTEGATEAFFLPKPFDPEKLASKVREALDSRR